MQHADREQIRIEHNSRVMMPATSSSGSISSAVMQPLPTSLCAGDMSSVTTQLTLLGVWKKAVSAFHCRPALP